MLAIGQFDDRLVNGEWVLCVTLLRNIRRGEQFMAKYL
jgi:hypothetical protein